MAEKKIYIQSFPIRLGQFLKYANEVQDGIEAKFLIQDGQVKVNGCVDTRRGRKLEENDIVQVGHGEKIVLCKLKV